MPRPFSRACGACRSRPRSTAVCGVRTCPSCHDLPINGGAKDFDRILAALKCNHVAGPGAHQGAAVRRRKVDTARGGIGLVMADARYGALGPLHRNTDAERTSVAEGEG